MIKKIMVAFLLLIMLLSLCACDNNSDYTVMHSSEEYSIIDYYTNGGDLYQVIEFNKQTGITIVTTYFWRYDTNGRRYLDRIEINRINEKGELMP